MEKLDLLLSWLSGWAGSLVGVDYLSRRPGSVALFPQGRRETSRREDILGGTCIRYEERFRLRLRLPLPPELSGSGNAGQLLDLQQWVKDNPAPALGREQTQQLKNARLVSAENTGLAVYEAEIVFCYTESA